jgi:hypothetical protein
VTNIISREVGFVCNVIAVARSIPNDLYNVFISSVILKDYPEMEANEDHYRDHNYYDEYI